MKTLLLATLAIFIFKTHAYARDFIIYSISQEIPMGEKNEVIKKNYYVNLGKRQGLKSGTLLDVYRTISRVDPYETKKRYDYSVKIGELKVIHSEETSAITRLISKNTDEDTPMFDIDGFMIGDQVNVKISD